MGVKERGQVRKLLLIIHERNNHSVAWTWVIVMEIMRSRPFLQIRTFKGGQGAVADKWNTGCLERPRLNVSFMTSKTGRM